MADAPRRYVVTGAASGMGSAVAESLRTQGHTVIGVDQRDADIIADLATPDGRRAAIAAILALCDGVLDGAVLAAGVGPKAGAERAIVEVNTLGVTELLTGLRYALATSNKAKVVVFGSNSTTSTPFVPKSAVRKLMKGDAAAAATIIRRRGKALSGPVAYAASKLAVTQWCRVHGTDLDWAGAGIRLNVIAPGPVMTPLLRAQLEGASGKNVRAFPVPLREYGTPEQLAAWVMLMLSSDADFMSGSVVTVDGGTEAYLRSRDWPVRLPLHEVPRTLWRMYRAPKEGRVVNY